MTTIHYHIVPHDGGYAYKLGDVFSEPFPTHAAHCAPPTAPPPSSASPVRPRSSSGRTTRANGTPKPLKATTGPRRM